MSFTASDKRALRLIVGTMLLLFVLFISFATYEAKESLLIKDSYSDEVAIGAKRVMSGEAALDNVKIPKYLFDDIGVKREIPGGPDSNPHGSYRLQDIGVKRQVPGGPDPNSHGAPKLRFMKDIGSKRQVPGGPDLNPHGALKLLLMKYIGVKRQVPGGPDLNPHGAPRIRFNDIGVKRQVLGGPDPNSQLLEIVSTILV
ncbi:hypothetical protein ACFE04_020870 [Oxalis oulophora]